MQRARIKVGKRIVLGVVAIAALTGGLVSATNVSVAGADSKVPGPGHQDLLPKFTDKTVPIFVPPANDPGCKYVPGIRRQGHVWSDTYVTDSLGRYVGLKWFFNTTYKEGVLVAKDNYKYQYGKEAPCSFLNTFDNKNEVEALRTMTCQNPWAVPGLKPARWCALANRSDFGQKRPATVNLNTEQCREPKWNNGNWGPMGWASWHNQHVKLETRDIWAQLGADWIPGHFNIDAHAEDFDQLSGVQNVDMSKLQPWDNPTGGEKRWIGYGKAQTSWASEVWVRFFDAVARAKGVNPINEPIKAHETTAPAAINANAKLTINLYPDIPAQSKAMTVKVGDFRRDLFQFICAASPWLADLVGDGSTAPPPLVVAIPGYPTCNIGLRLWRPTSSRANGWSFREFVQRNNPDSVKDLAGHEAEQSQVLQEAFMNRDTVNPMLIKSPLHVDEKTGKAVIECRVERNLGVSRGSTPSGGVDVNKKDPHFRLFFKG